MEYLKFRTLIKKMQISKKTLYDLIAAGMPVVELPTGSRLYHWPSIDKWLQQYSTKQNQTITEILGGK